MLREQAGKALAANLRARRERAGMSLSELARRSGIAKGTLSHLESGQGNPTIETVYCLSHGLGVPVPSLLDEQPDPEVVLVRSAGLEVLSGKAVDLRTLRRLEFDRTVIEVFDQRIRPGRSQRSEGHPGREHIIVAEGRLRAGPAEAPYELGAGDYISFPARDPHLYETVDGPVASVLLLEYPSGAEPSTVGRSCATLGGESGVNGRDPIEHRRAGESRIVHGDGRR